MQVKISGIKEAIGRLDQLGVRAKFAAARALDEVAHSIMVAERKEIISAFPGGVTPMIQRGVTYDPPRVDNLTTTVKLNSKDFSTTFDREDDEKVSAANILRTHIEGGDRIILKNSEIHLRIVGVLKSNQYVVPSKHIQLDANGNVPGKMMVKIMSAAGLFMENGYAMNQSERSRKRNPGAMRGVYCVPFVGIFQHTAAQGSGNRRWKTKHGGAGIPLIFFARKPRYKAGRFRFYETGRKMALEQLPGKLRKHLKVEMKR